MFEIHGFTTGIISRALIAFRGAALAPHGDHNSCLAPRMLDTDSLVSYPVGSDAIAEIIQVVKTANAAADAVARERAGVTEDDDCGCVLPQPIRYRLRHENGASLLILLYGEGNSYVGLDVRSAHEQCSAEYHPFVGVWHRRPCSIGVRARAMFCDAPVTVVCVGPLDMTRPVIRGNVSVEEAIVAITK